MRLRLLASLALVAILLVACGQPPQAQENPDLPFQVTPIVGTPDSSQFTDGTDAYPYPGPMVVGPATDDPYPAPETAEQVTGAGRGQTALSSLPIAQQIAAEQFAPEAQLYAVLPSTIMLGNLGNPPVQQGWFYKFKTEDSPREFIVQIVDGRVTGSLETEPLVPPQQREEAIPLDLVTLDSDQVFAQLQQQAPELGLSIDDPETFDLELVKLASTSGPVWSVFDPTDNRWLFSLDATTGEEVPNPRG